MNRFTRVARSRVSGQHDVGHEGVITGRDGFSLRSYIADPQGVAQSPLQSTNIHNIGFNKHHSLLIRSQHIALFFLIKQDDMDEYGV
ncbi:hypothetical protein [Lysinibacillus sp. RC79]|uniref:hypothetical protein n=1 Tax=Lysinibacillus sp. RC79 TaxID=3156296 RepID=UPI003519C394